MQPGPRIKRRRSVTFHPDVVGGTSPPASPGASRMQSARGESSKGWLTAVSDFVRYWVMPRSSQ